MTTLINSNDKRNRLLIFGLLGVIGAMVVSCIFNGAIPVRHYIFGSDHSFDHVASIIASTEPTTLTAKLLCILDLRPRRDDDILAERLRATGMPSCAAYENIRSVASFRDPQRLCEENDRPDRSCHDIKRRRQNNAHEEHGLARQISQGRCRHGIASDWHLVAGRRPGRPGGDRNLGLRNSADRDRRHERLPRIHPLRDIHPPQPGRDIRARRSRNQRSIGDSELSI